MTCSRGRNSHRVMTIERSHEIEVSRMAAMRIASGRKQRERSGRDVDVNGRNRAGVVILALGDASRGARPARVQWPGTAPTPGTARRDRQYFGLVAVITQCPVTTSTEIELQSLTGTTPGTRHCPARRPAALGRAADPDPAPRTATTALANTTSDPRPASKCTIQRRAAHSPVCENRGTAGPRTTPRERLARDLGRRRAVAVVHDGFRHEAEREGRELHPPRPFDVFALRGSARRIRRLPRTRRAQTPRLPEGAKGRNPPRRKSRRRAAGATTARSRSLIEPASSAPVTTSKSRALAAMRRDPVATHDVVGIAEQEEVAVVRPAPRVRAKPGPGRSDASTIVSSGSRSAHCRGNLAGVVGRAVVGDDDLPRPAVGLVRERCELVRRASPPRCGRG